MSAPDRRAMVGRPGEDLSVRRQCALLNVARSGVYRSKAEPGAEDLALMRRIDGKRYEHTRVCPGCSGGYVTRANRIGIQSWRVASTTVGMSRQAS